MMTRPDALLRGSEFDVLSPELAQFPHDLNSGADMTNKRKQEPPPRWGDDYLTEYLDHARGNQFATFANKAAAGELITIDACFKKVEDGWINPRPYLPAQFMLRAHGVYRSAVGAAFAGQAFEVYPLLRTCLECSAYGLHIAADESRATAWWNQQDSDTAKEAFRKEFVQGRLRKTMETHSGKLLEVYDLLYRRTIEYGGHPNADAFFSNMRSRLGDGSVHLQSIFLHEDGHQLDLSLKTAGQIGLWALHAFQLVYKERFMLLGVKETLNNIRVSANL